MKVNVLKQKADELLQNYRQKDPATYAAAQQAIGGVLILDGFVGIEKPFGGNSRPGIFGSLAGIAFGILFMFIPTIFENLTGMKDMTATTTGQVVSVSQDTVPSQNTSSSQNTTSSTNSGPTCAVTARYMVAGKPYTQQSASSSGGNCSFSQGETITVSYNPARPGQWMTDIETVKNMFKIFFYVGLFIVVTSLFTFAIRLISILFGWKLVRSGRALAATLPQGTDISSTVSQIKNTFISMLNGNSGQQNTSPPEVSTVQAPTPVQIPSVPIVPIPTPPVQQNPPSTETQVVQNPGEQEIVPPQAPTQPIAPSTPPVAPPPSDKREV